MSENISQTLHEYSPPTVIEAYDYIERPKAAITSLPERTITHPEPQPEMWRGIFAPAYKWKALFSQQVRIQPEGLPRLKPHIAINLRAIEEEDE